MKKIFIFSKLSGFLRFDRPPGLVLPVEHRVEQQFGDGAQRRHPLVGGEQSVLEEEEEDCVCVD
jgi:hypothetical protein